MKYKEMEDLMSFLFARYRSSRKNEVQESEVEYGDSLCALMKEALQLLSSEELKMIENEFIFEDKNWWYQFYSRSTYYRLKNFLWKNILNY